MRVGNLDGRLVIVTGEAGHEIGYDVEKSSGGQFSADPQAVYDVWGAFTAWAAAGQFSDGTPVRPEALGSPAPAPGRYSASASTTASTPPSPASTRRPGSRRCSPSSPAPSPARRGDIEMPTGGKVDWEVELVVVIGRRAHRVGEDEALDYVAGYAVGQDVSERGLQVAAKPPQFSMGKSLPGFGPIGPWLVTFDDVADPNDLELGCEVNGEVVQLSRTSQLIFSVPALIANLSASVPLLPGDVIFTGTPSGVGLGRNPPRYLAHGDVLTSHIESLGEMRHRFVAAAGASHGPAPADPHRHGRSQRRGDGRLLRGVRPHPRRRRPGGPGERTFATVDGGEQLTIVHSPQRRLVGSASASTIRTTSTGSRPRWPLSGCPPGATRSASGRRIPAPEVTVRVEIAARIAQEPTPAPAFNAPGVTARTDERAPGILRERPVRPRKLGHVVLGSTDRETSQRFFTDGIGLKVSDEVPGIAAFLRCSTDHHNVLVQQAPVAFLHHTSWQVDDVDEVGRGASAMLEADPSRHTWGLGRHFIGSNFFWYLKDPAGNFSEYYSDLDCIVEDALWNPGVWEGARSLWAWGPPPPASFLAPDDLGALMTGAHQAP